MTIRIFVLFGTNQDFVQDFRRVSGSVGGNCGRLRPTTNPPPNKKLRKLLKRIHTCGMKFERYAMTFQIENHSNGEYSFKCSGVNISMHNNKDLCKCVVDCHVANFQQQSFSEMI